MLPRTQASLPSGVWSLWVHGCGQQLVATMSLLMMFLRFLGVDPDPGAGWEPSLCCQNSAGFWGTAVNATSLFFEGKEPDVGGIRGRGAERRCRAFSGCSRCR